MSTSYVPGVCNIGAAEIRARARFGYLGLAVTIIAIVLFVVFRVPDAWRLLVILPAVGAAMGFLQAGLHFCAGFAMSGVFNFGNDVTRRESVETAEQRAKDRRKAGLILVWSFLIGVAVAVIAVLLP